PPVTDREQQTASNLGLFVLLLVLVVGLLVVFASGILRFGLSGPITYLIYVLFGLTSALLTFGVLSSWGYVKSSSHSTEVRFGGALVALALVAGGGGLYEKYLHTPETFEIRVNLYGAGGDPQAVTGTLRVGYRTIRSEVTLHQDDSAVIQGIPSDMLGQSIEITLDSPHWRIPATEGSQPADNKHPLRVMVTPKSYWAQPEEAVLEIVASEAQAYDFLPEPEKKNLVLVFAVTNPGLKPVPLNNSAELLLRNQSLRVLERIPLKLTDELPEAGPGRSQLYSDSLISRDIYDVLFGGGVSLAVRFTYAKVDDVEFVSDDFTLIDILKTPR
ncbi:MAG: hypothetical protein KC431_30800, partial [Myxococcales bacterium]|nr:hypothetical protein [Myxococcales bacterium]